MTEDRLREIKAMRSEWRMNDYGPSVPRRDTDAHMLAIEELVLEVERLKAVRGELTDGE